MYSITCWSVSYNYFIDYICRNWKIWAVTSYYLPWDATKPVVKSIRTKYNTVCGIIAIALKLMINFTTKYSIKSLKSVQQTVVTLFKVLRKLFFIYIFPGNRCNWVCNLKNNWQIFKQSVYLNSKCKISRLC